MTSNFKLKFGWHGLFFLAFLFVCSIGALAVAGPADFRKIGVMINTDDNPDTREKHADNVDRAIAALLAEDSSFVFYVISPTKPKRSDSWLAVSGNNFDALFESVVHDASSETLVVIYITGHGSLSPSGETSLPLPNNEFYTAERLIQRIDQIPYGKRFIAMDTCLSGNAFSRFANENTVVFTAGRPGENVYCHTVAQYFWSRSRTMDTNRDNLITLQERFDYLMESQAKTGHLQNPLFFGSAELPFSLSGRQQSYGNFQTKVVEIQNRTELQMELASMRPSELALVVFSADWCGPCQAYKSVFDQLAKDYSGRFKMIRLESLNGSADEVFKVYNIDAVPSIGFMDRTEKLRLLDPETETRENPLRYVAQFTISTEDQLEIYLQEFEKLSSENTLHSQAANTLFRKMGNLGKEAAPALPRIKKILLENKINFFPEGLDQMILDMGPDTYPILIKDWLTVRNDESRIVSAIAIHALTEVQKESIPLLVAALHDAQKDKNTHWMVNILQCFRRGHVNTAPYMNEVIPLLEYAENEVVVHALRAIGDMHPENVAALPTVSFVLMRSQDDKIIAEALSTLSYYGSPMIPLPTKVVDRVKTLLESRNQTVQLNAADVLLVYHIEQPDIKPMLFALIEGSGWLDAYRVLGKAKLTLEERRFLTRKLSSKRNGDAFGSYYALASQGYKQAPEAFLTLLIALKLQISSRGEDYDQTNAEYIEMAGCFGDPQFLPVLIESTNDPILGVASFLGIACMGEPAIPWLIKTIQTSPKRKPPLAHVLTLIFIVEKMDEMPVEIPKTIKVFLKRYKKHFSTGLLKLVEEAYQSAEQQVAINRVTLELRAIFESESFQRLILELTQAGFMNIP